MGYLKLSNLFLFIKMFHKNVTKSMENINFLTLGCIVLYYLSEYVCSLTYILKSDSFVFTTRSIVVRLWIQLTTKYLARQ